MESNVNGLRICEDDFESLPIEKQLSIIYKNLEEISKKLNNRKSIDTALTAVTGFIGGVFAVVGKWFFLKG